MRKSGAFQVWRVYWHVTLWRYVLFLGMCAGGLGLGFPASAASASSDPAQQRPSLYVLSIGVTKYQDNRLPALRYADDDARSIVEWAKGQEGRLYQKVYTQILLDSAATRRSIIQQIVQFYRGAGPKDQLILFIAGHGIIEQSTGAYHFLPNDAESDNVAGTGLEQDDILQKLEVEGQRDRRVLVLMDTCHAGALSDALLKVNDGRRGGSYIGGTPNPVTDDDVADKLSLWAVFSAGTAQDLAEEGPTYRLPQDPPGVEGHGLFTFAILQALGSTAADRDRNGAVTLTEFQQHVTSAVKERSRGLQLPLLSGKLTDLALAWAPGTVEICDGLDNDLDGNIDEEFPDKNRNGTADCLEQDVCNGIDDNGNGLVDEGFDLDKDGYNSRVLCGEFGNDCDDNDITIHPNQKDWGNLHDDDCDGQYDEDDFDRDGNNIPDHMEDRATTFKRTRFALLGLGTAMVAGSIYSYSRLAATQSSTDYMVEEGDAATYVTWSRLTAAFGSSGALILGVSGTFAVAEFRFKERVFPKVRILPVNAR